MVLTLEVAVAEQKAELMEYEMVEEMAAWMVLRKEIGKVVQRVGLKVCI